MVFFPSLEHSPTPQVSVRGVKHSVGDSPPPPLVQAADGACLGQKVGEFGGVLPVVSSTLHLLVPKKMPCHLTSLVGMI